MINEAAKERRIVTTPFNFSTQEILAGKFVHLGYIEDSNSMSSHGFKYGPKTMKYVNAKNDEELGSRIDKLGQSKFGSALGNVRNSEKYQASLSGAKSTTPFDLGDGHVVKIGTYTINWRDNESLAKDFQSATEREWNIRLNHGFGKDASEYQEDDWRQKYGGTGKMRQTDPKYANNGTRYTDYKGSGFWANIDDQNKLAARQNLASDAKNLQSSRWYFVDEQGELEILDKELMKFLVKSFGKPAVEKAVEEVSEDEKAFKAEMTQLNDYRALVNKQFLMSNILYIVATVLNKETGKTEAITWINQEVFDNFSYIDKGELSRIIQAETKTITV